MCGIAGMVSVGRVDRSVLEGMTRAIAHRGPDDSGLWIDEEVGVGFGHRRLSIVDLSPAGHQAEQTQRYVARMVAPIRPPLHLSRHPFTFNPQHKLLQRSGVHGKVHHSRLHQARVMHFAVNA